MVETAILTQWQVPEARTVSAAALTTRCDYEFDDEIHPNGLASGSGSGSGKKT